MTIREIKNKLSLLLDKRDYKSIVESTLKAKDLIAKSQKDFKYLSAIKFYHAFAYWQLSKKDNAIESIKQSLYFDRTNKESYWLIREMNSTSVANKYYRILINGEWIENEYSSKKMGFYSSYDIVASSKKKALNFIKEYETAPINHETLKIDEIEELKFDPTENPSGIYKVNGFSLYEIK